MNQLITAEFIGRLGNSLFQVAAMIGYAKKHNCRYGVQHNQRESTILNHFPHLPKFEGYGRRYNEPRFDYDELPYTGKPMHLVGFFQSERYFENAKEEVKNTFKLNFVEGLQDYVSLHVRRGDYVQHSGSFPPITPEYVNLAIDAVRNSGVDVKNILCFSDDIKWCRENIKSSGIEFSEGKNEFDDLSLMHSCGNHIIANSTFSWWGAWLGHNPNKIIVTPSQDGFNWFGPEGGVKNPRTLIPDGWIQIRFR